MQQEIVSYDRVRDLIPAQRNTDADPETVKQFDQQRRIGDMVKAMTPVQFTHDEIAAQRERLAAALQRMREADVVRVMHWTGLRSPFSKTRNWAVLDMNSN